MMGQEITQNRDQSNNEQLKLISLKAKILLGQQINGFNRDKPPPSIYMDGMCLLVGAL